MTYRVWTVDSGLDARYKDAVCEDYSATPGIKDTEMTFSGNIKESKPPNMKDTWESEVSPLN